MTMEEDIQAGKHPKTYCQELEEEIEALQEYLCAT
uniref:Uncharacterized protein n=1 Tax=Arundo donax TaxID=35708 RepID=A0A0A9C124_ARUDO